LKEEVAEVEHHIHQSDDERTEK